MGHIIYVLGHRDGRFGDVYIRPVEVNVLKDSTVREGGGGTIRKKKIVQQIRAVQFNPLTAVDVYIRQGE